MPDVDMLGQTIEVGDLVVISGGGRYGGPPRLAIYDGCTPQKYRFALPKRTYDYALGKYVMRGLSKTNLNAAAQHKAPCVFVVAGPIDEEEFYEYLQFGIPRNNWIQVVG